MEMPSFLVELLLAGLAKSKVLLQIQYVMPNMCQWEYVLGTSIGLEPIFMHRFPSHSSNSDLLQQSSHN